MEKILATPYCLQGLRVKFTSPLTDGEAEVERGKSSGSKVTQSGLLPGNSDLDFSIQNKTEQVTIEL